jgi:hypothetical protein
MDQNVGSLKESALITKQFASQMELYKYNVTLFLINLHIQTLGRTSLNRVKRDRSGVSYKHSTFLPVGFACVSVHNKQPLTESYTAPTDKE